MYIDSIEGADENFLDILNTGTPVTLKIGWRSQKPNQLSPPSKFIYPCMFSYNPQTGLYAREETSWESFKCIQGFRSLHLYNTPSWSDFMEYFNRQGSDKRNLICLADDTAKCFIYVSMIKKVWHFIQIASRGNMKLPTTGKMWKTS